MPRKYEVEDVKALSDETLSEAVFGQLHKLSFSDPNQAKMVPGALLAPRQTIRALEGADEGTQNAETLLREFYGRIVSAAVQEYGPGILTTAQEETRA